MNAAGGPRLGQRVRFTAQHGILPIGAAGMIDQVSGDRFVVLLDAGAWFFWTTFEKWEPTGEPDVELPADYRAMRAEAAPLTRDIHRGDRVTTGHVNRVWTVEHVGGELATLRDDQGVECVVPVATLWLVRRGPLCLAAAIVLVFAGICAACIYRVASGDVAIDRATGAVMVSIASVSVIAWMVVLLRGAWRRP